MQSLKIKRIDINNFGCYRNYRQHGQTGIGNDFNVDRVNIFYGRNYSGKSTYSRIFQSIELGEFPDGYSDIDFEIKLANNSVIKTNNIVNGNLPIDCKVFNQRFIDDNIYLHNDNKLNSFQISIGSDANEILKNIEHIRSNELKPKEDELIKLESKIFDIKSSFDKKNTNLDTRLREIASKIKNIKNPSVIHGSKYDIRDIKGELAKDQEQFLIFPSVDDEEATRELNQKIEDEKIKIFEENIDKPQKLDIVTVDSSFDFNLFLEETKQLLSKVISVSDILDEYKHSSDKINWIKSGVNLHGEDPEKCIFCGNGINGELIKTLKLAFSDELSSLEEKLMLQMKIITSEIERLNSVPSLEKDNYFKEDTDEVENINQEISNIKSKRTAVLNEIKFKISEKQQDIFSKTRIGDVIWSDYSIIQARIDLLYDKTIEKIEQYETRKKKSVDFLRRYYITQELPISEFIKLSQEVNQLKQNLDAESEKLKELEIEKKKIESSISELESGLKSEYEAVKRINLILQNSLAHSEISLKSVDNDEGIIFEVTRNGEKAYNLSEGEKSLIAFAYYIASLESLSIEEKTKTVLFIDDPISSLDENNIFYIYNLIFRLFEKKEFLQYFLSTHNLDFLKYTNRFSVPKDYYLVEKIKESESGPSKSRIQKLPKHLSDKVTEFVFLFEQIYIVATTEETEENFSVFYNFPNNGRKFIETLLYFKYPNYKSKIDDKIIKYFGSDNAAFIQRINNEYSHGEDKFDRTRNPINTSEFQHDARIILKALHQKDLEQFESFLQNSKLDFPNFITDK